mmetsp:Transcript_17624/g.46145  ORF Transcript_17624/g.46145 Transcript_17624/m.46145 type:complete len:87 (+) Transcript_17624:700-960(+)
MLFCSSVKAKETPLCPSHAMVPDCTSSLESWVSPAYRWQCHPNFTEGHADEVMWLTVQIKACPRHRAACVEAAGCRQEQRQLCQGP